MIFDTIILENFGAYGGRQEANLTPEDEKPIILFGGMNGGGKTTLLDAIQLAFYGPKARISNRGRLSYKEYLRESIYRGCDPGDGASITLRFRRAMEGETRKFEVHRHWWVGGKGVEETVRVLRDGIPDDLLTEHWGEHIEDYLPSSIAHLFFFDGEQIKELAEGGHTAEILGTAIHSLLGLDLVDRVENDLKMFERRKKAEGLSPEAAQRLAQARGELVEIDREQEKAAMDEGTLVNEAGRLAKELQVKEDLFRAEGGELFLKHKDLENELAALKSKKKALEFRLREIVAGPLPLLSVEPLLAEVEQVVRHEAEVKHARFLRDTLEVRDAAILKTLKSQKIAAQSLHAMAKSLENDREIRAGLAKEELLLEADDVLAPQIAHLCAAVLPAAARETGDLAAAIKDLDEKVARIEAELERVPTVERIAEVQLEMAALQKAHRVKVAELEAITVRRQALQRQRLLAEGRVDRMCENDVNAKFSEDARQRMVKHSRKVRETLARFRTRVVKCHTESMEALMLESFRKLLRKKELVNSLSINPETFEATLMTKTGKPLPFDRLSAGEKQLLATSLLWGLARASGRPVPTIIDTPLGRLDSSHRKHLIEGYFPNASHQVILLSTDEEIVGDYLIQLKPFISRSYLLEHNEETGQTNVRRGYFKQ